MRLHRFYTNTPIGSKSFDLTDRDLIHQWKSVFRYNVGSQVILFDGSGTDYLCMITSLRNLGATLEVFKEKKTDSAPRKNVWLCMALVKKDNFELIAQKVTELGVNGIIPILCEHSEKRKLNMERLNKILVEASEQSGRGDVPVLHEVMKIEEVFQKGILPQEKIVLHPEGDSFHKYISGLSSVHSFAVFVGPEGGFSPKEIALFKSYNVPAISLGSQILRAETAAIAISSLLIL
ncbi:MAG: 16S rRNA (uracil1498-N3)-methyltransferase [Parcubacteria group bacterium Gr01-1014_46]|nr:MAG: 16S rRNA (uracil1498-N3)-methyltransferase [Parcubacteria group bacterium Gr01-1014_46]